MPKNLLIINGFYPFGYGEPFLESEINFYQRFERVLIFPCTVNDKSHREINQPNIEVITKKQEVLLNGVCLKKTLAAFVALFNPIVVTELVNLKKNGKLNIETIKTLLSFVSTAEYNFKIIKQLLKKRHFSSQDQFVFYSYWMDFHSYIVIKLKKFFPNSIAVSRCHRFDLYEYIHPNKYIPLRPWILNNLDATFSISSDGKKYLEDKYFSVRKNIQVSRLGTFDKGFRPVSISKKGFEIVSCSWVVPVKRIKFIIDALSDMGDLAIRWTHFGNGDLLENMKKYARDNIKGKVTYDFKGPVSNEEILKAYKSHDYHLFLNVSESEGIPVSIMEAMSSGIPVIATDVGGTNEIVQDNYNGFLLNKDFKIEDLKRCILKVYEMNDTEYAFFRNNARSFWSRHYNAQENYQDFVAELLRLVESSNNRSFF